MPEEQEIETGGKTSRMSWLRDLPNLRNLTRPIIAYLVVGSYVAVLLKMAWVLLGTTDPKAVELAAQVASNPIFAGHSLLTGLVVGNYFKGPEDQT